MANELIPAPGGHPVLAYVYDGTDWRPALIDTSGHLQVDVLTSGLPSGAATDTVLQAVRDRIGALTSPVSGSTNKLLTDALTALQLIDDLRAALQSVDTDALQVRGEDQLFSYKGEYSQRTQTTNANAGSHSLYGSTVPAGESWKVTGIATYNVNTNMARVRFAYVTGGATKYLGQESPSAAGEVVSWTGEVWLDGGDRIRVIHDGTSAGDDIYCDIHGLKMSVES